MSGRPGTTCCIPDCLKQVWIVGRCSVHARVLRETNPAEFARIQGLNTEERAHEFYMTKNPLPPKFEWEGDEPALIRTYGRQTKHHVRVGFQSKAAQQGNSDVNSQEEIENGN